MSKEIIINHLVQEIRVAIREDGKLSGLHYERTKDKSVVGNIYKAKVLKVLPGMEAAFLDVGLAKAAFLYVSDIYVADSEVEEDSMDDEGNSQDDTASNKPAAAVQNLKINDLIKENQDIMVQVVKGPISVKGARVTCNISIAGRNVVLLPQSSNVAVSKQINNSRERNRLKNIVKKHRPDDLGFIIRTIGQKREEEEFIADIGYLSETWNKINENFEKDSSPSLLHGELNLTHRIMREVLNHEVDTVYIDNHEEYDKLKDYLDKYLSWHAKKLKLFDKKCNIFDHYDIDVEIDRALNRKVVLPSGGYVIIDQVEALTAIDINTGSFIGSNNHEETILQTNIEATVEIAYQLKLRDIGGIIIIDYIDMEVATNRTMIYNLLKDELRGDKAKTKVVGFSELGIVEMTRKRSKESLNQFLCQNCPFCVGSGQVKTIETIIYDILRDIYDYARNKKTPQKNFIVIANQDVAFSMEHSSVKEKQHLEKICNGNIRIQVSNEFHLEQYEILEY